MQTPGPSGRSALTPIGYSNSSCGYCKNNSGSFSYYAATSSLTPEFYESLLNRGWRRSGTTLYKPDQHASCCPQYTIRLDSHGFHASKDQRQTLNRFNKFVLGHEYREESARLYPKSREQAKKRNTDFEVTERIHESEKSWLKTPPEPAHTLLVTLEPDKFTEEKYVLFENYQRVVHHEPPHRISKHGFSNFLCSSPVSRSEKIFDGRNRKLGSYHQCYRLDGKLVAVGVLDLLPQCVSAVYFMYHDSVHQHNFGKIGALREIALAKEEGYRWWYAGFYIHSCVKMRYKGDYAPQYILDPESYDWDLLDDGVKKKLDENKFLSLSQERRRLEGAPEERRSVIPKERSSELAPEFPDPDFEDPASDSDDEPPVPNPSLPLFSRSMPGILTKDQLENDIDLDHIQLRIQGEEAETCDLLGWASGSIGNVKSIKGIIADLVSAVGVGAAKEMVVSFR